MRKANEVPGAEFFRDRNNGFVLVSFLFILFGLQIVCYIPLLLFVIVSSKFLVSSFCCQYFLGAKKKDLVVRE